MGVQGDMFPEVSREIHIQRGIRTEIDNIADQELSWHDKARRYFTVYATQNHEFTTEDVVEWAHLHARYPLPTAPSGDDRSWGSVALAAARLNTVRPNGYRYTVGHGRVSGKRRARGNAKPMTLWRSNVTRSAPPPPPQAKVARVVTHLSIPRGGVACGAHLVRIGETGTGLASDDDRSAVTCLRCKGTNAFAGPL